MGHAHKPREVKGAFMRKLLVFLLNLVCFLSANPGICAEAVDVIVGDTRISLPAPKGFYEISKVSPDIRKIAEASTPANNRLIAVFISEADLGKIMKGEDANLDRYMLIQVHRASEGTNLPASQFQQLAQKLKQEQGTTVDREKAQSQLNQLSGGISKKFGISLDIKVGQTVPLGVFADSPNFVAFATLAKYQTSTEKDKLDYLVASSTSFIRASNRLLFAFVYATYGSQKDLDWLRIA